MEFWKKKLHRKVVLLVGCLLAVSFFTIITLYNASMKTLVDNRVHDVELPTILLQVRNAIEYELSIPVRISKLMAQNSYVVNWANEGESEEGEQALIDMLNDIQKNEGASTTYWVSYQSGKYFFQDGLSRVLSPSAKQDKWFYDFLATDNAYELDIALDLDSKISTVFINYRVSYKGKTLGAAGMGKTLSALKDIANSQNAVGRKVYIVDNKGNLKSNDSTDKINTLSELTGLTNLDELFTTSGLGEIEFSRDGIEYIASAMHIPLVDWYVIAEVQKSSLYKDVNNTTTLTTIISLGLVLLLLLIVYRSVRKALLPLGLISNALSYASDSGDISRELQVNTEDEIGQLAGAFNKNNDTMRKLLNQIKQGANTVHDSVGKVAGSADATLSHTSTQQEKTQLVANAIVEMGSTVEEIASNASHAAQLSSAAKSEASSGSQTIAKTVSQMEKLSENIGNAEKVVSSLATDVESISSVLAVIAGISEQTNLLALNAAIEAARAGEQGRGFAVVADEVRTLAQRTQESTEEINQMIDRLQKGSQQAVDVMVSGNEATMTSVQYVEEVSGHLAEIQSVVDQISGMNEQIAQATEEQHKMNANINEHIKVVSQISDDSSTAAKSSVEACQSMNDVALSLRTTVSHFKSE